MSIKNPIGLKKLQYFFPKLPEIKQEYILGIAEGLMYMQGKYSDLIETAPYTGKSVANRREGCQMKN